MHETLVTTPRRPKRAALVIACVLALLVASAAALYAVDRLRPLTLSGTMTITENVSGGRVCLGINGFEDIRGGAPVVVRGPSGELAGSGTLGDGVGDRLIAGGAQRCRFAFRVPVPREKVYDVQVGDRRPQRFTAEQARAGAVRFSLGS